MYCSRQRFAVIIRKTAFDVNPFLTQFPLNYLDTSASPSYTRYASLFAFPKDGTDEKKRLIIPRRDEFDKNLLAL